MMTTTVEHAPLSADFARLRQVSSYINIAVGAPVGGGWVTVEGLLEPGGDQLAAMLEQIGAHYKTADRRFMAMTAFGNVLWQAAAAGVGGALAFGRVPDLSPANLSLRVGASGWGEQLSLARGRFVALPGRDEGGHPEVELVGTADELREAYLRPIRDELAPRLIDALRASSPLGGRALWSALADRLVGTALWLGKELGRAEGGLAEAEALSGAVPEAPKTGIFWVEWAGARHAFLKRGSCCYSYKLPGCEYCSSCPLQSVAERTRRFQEELAPG